MLLVSNHQKIKFIFIILFFKPHFSSNFFEDTSSSMIKRSLLNPYTKVYAFSRKPRTPELSLPLQLAGGRSAWEEQDLSWLSAEALEDLLTQYNSNRGETRFHSLGHLTRPGSGEGQMRRM